MPTYLYSHNRVSAGARLLALAAGINRFWPATVSRPSSVVLRGGDTVINWGAKRIRYNGRDLSAIGLRIINNPTAVINNSDKVSFFRNCASMNDLSGYIPRIALTREDAATLFLRTPSGYSRGNIRRVVCRTTTTGHSGEGIVIADDVNQLVDAPLYVEYIPKSNEYRAHFTYTPERGESVFSIQRKARILTVPDDQVNWSVRNLDGGFTYANAGVNDNIVTNINYLVRLYAQSSGLNFGALDIIESRQGWYLLEVNTAPGLSEPNAERYYNAFVSAGFIL